MKKVVVTGSNGFLGTYLCRALTESGIEVFAIVKDTSSDIESLKSLQNLHIIYCDMSSYHSLPKMISSDAIDVFYHMAWMGSSGEKRGDSETQLRNIQYTCDAVEACMELECRRFLFAGSIMEFEVSDIMESDTPPGINTLYCSAKLSADYFARTLCAKYGIEYIRAIISNVYGPGEHSPRLINQSLRKMINGEHCSFSSGEQLYDFIYATDAAKAFKSLGEQGIPNKSYYIGSLAPKSLKEFLVEMKDVVNPEIELGLGEIKSAGKSIDYNRFDIRAVLTDTGVSPAVTFADGIKKTVDWIRENS